MTKVIRWTARIISGLIVGLIPLFFVAHFIGGIINPDEGFKFKTLPISTIVCFVFIGILSLGLPVAWKYELAGGIIALAGYLSFLALSPGSIDTWPFLIFFFCGVLFVGCRYSDIYYSR